MTHLFADMADGEAGSDREGLFAAESVFSRSLMRSSSVGTFLDSTSSSCTLFRLETSRFRVVCSSRTRLCLRRRVSLADFEMLVTVLVNFVFGKLIILTCAGQFGTIQD